MKKSDIAKIAKLVGEALPDGYVQSLLNPPTEVVSLRNDRFPLEHAFYCELKPVLAMNRLVRERGYRYENAAGEECTWPNEHIIIGMNAGGDFFTIKTTAKRTRVYMWNHETGEFDEIAPSLAMFFKVIVAAN